MTSDTQICIDCCVNINIRSLHHESPCTKAAAAYGLLKADSVKQAVCYKVIAGRTSSKNGLAWPAQMHACSDPYNLPTPAGDLLNQLHTRLSMKYFTLLSQCIRSVGAGHTTYVKLAVMPCFL